MSARRDDAAAIRAALRARCWDELEPRSTGSSGAARRPDEAAHGRRADPARVAALYRARLRAPGAGARARLSGAPGRAPGGADAARAPAHLPPRRLRPGAPGRLFLVDFPQAVRAHARLRAGGRAGVRAAAAGARRRAATSTPASCCSLHDAQRVAASTNACTRQRAEPRPPARRRQRLGRCSATTSCNNIGIAFQCFAGGLFVGIGSLFFLVFNGAATPARIAGYLTARGLGENFYSFVVTHGAFELTAIVLSGAAGLRSAMRCWRPGRRTPARRRSPRPRARAVVAASTA